MDNSVEEMKDYNTLAVENFNLRLRCYYLNKQLYGNKYQNEEMENHPAYDPVSENEKILQKYDALVFENQKLQLQNQELIKFKNEVAIEFPKNVDKMKEIISDFTKFSCSNEPNVIQKTFNELLELTLNYVEKVESSQRKNVELNIQLSEIMNANRDELHQNLRTQVSKSLNLLQTSVNQNLNTSLEVSRLRNQQSMNEEGSEEKRNCVECDLLKTLIEKYCEDLLSVQSKNRMNIDKIAELEVELRQIKAELASKQPIEDESKDAAVVKLKKLVIKAFNKQEIVKTEIKKMQQYYSNEISNLNDQSFKLKEKLLHVVKDIENMANCVISTWNFLNCEDDEGLIKDLELIIGTHQKNVDVLLDKTLKFFNLLTRRVRNKFMEINYKSKKNEKDSLSLPASLGYAKNLVEEVIELCDSFANQELDDSTNRTMNNSTLNQFQQIESVSNISFNASTKSLMNTSQIGGVMDRLKILGEAISEIETKLQVIDLDKTIDKSFQSNNDESKDAFLLEEQINEKESMILQLKVEKNNLEYDIKILNENLIDTVNEYEEQLKNLKIDQKFHIDELREDCDKLYVDLQNAKKAYYQLIEDNKKLTNDFNNRNDLINNMTESMHVAMEEAIKCRRYIQRLYMSYLGIEMDENKDEEEIDVDNEEIQSELIKFVKESTTQQKQNQQVIKRDNEAQVDLKSMEFLHYQFIEEKFEFNNTIKSNNVDIDDFNKTQTTLQRKSDSTSPSTLSNKENIQITETSCKSISAGQFSSNSNLNSKQNTDDLKKQLEKKEATILELKKRLKDYRSSIPEMNKLIEGYKNQLKTLDIYVTKAVKYLPEPLKKEWQQNNICS